MIDEDSEVELGPWGIIAVIALIISIALVVLYFVGYHGGT